MLCTSKIHPFSLGSYLGTSLIMRNLMITRVTNVDVDDVAPPIIVMLNVIHHRYLVSY
jgi:hypothetical protein